MNNIFCKPSLPIFLILCSLSLTSCSWFSEDEKPKTVSGKKREIETSIKDGEINLTINENIIDAKKFIAEYMSKLPKPLENKSWFRKGYVPAENLKLSKKPTDYSYYSAGSSPKRSFDISAIPIIAEDKIFTLGGQGELHARNVSDPSQKLWKVVIEKELLHDNRKDADWLDDVESFFKDKDEFLGGNICYSIGTVFVTTKRGNVFAFNASSGSLIWQKSIGSPLRSSPIAKNNILIVSTIENKTIALDATSGELIWEHEASEEKNKLASSPAHLIIGDKVIVTYSSGEIYAISIKDGEEIWETIISPERITVLLPTNNDVPYSPLYHDGIIVLVSAEGTVYALEENSGEEIWRFEGNAIIHEPWAVSGFIFMINRFGEIYAISAKSGSTIWRKYLADPKVIDEDNLIFTSPIMANGEIYVADNEGTLRAYSPKDGKINSVIDIEDNVLQSPVVAGGKMYILSNDSDLLVLE